MRRLGRILMRLLGFVMIGAACILLYLGYEQWQEYQDAIGNYDELREEVVSKETDDTEGSDDADTWLEIDWDRLKSINPDIIAWISMDSGADYPILQGDDNDFYLHHDQNGDYSINGSIFMHYENSSDFTDRNTVIYGHNMRNGSMFGSNKKYKDEEYANAHPYFYIYTPEGRFSYKIYQTHVVIDATDIYQTSFESNAAFSTWLKDTLSTVEFQLGDQAEAGDRVVTLSTCMSAGDHRYVIQGYAEEFETYDHATIQSREDLQIFDSYIIMEQDDSQQTGN